MRCFGYGPGTLIVNFRSFRQKIEKFDFGIFGYVESVFWVILKFKNFRRNFGFSNFRQISPMLIYIWTVRSIISPLLTYIWTVRSIFPGMLMSRRAAGGRGGSRGSRGVAGGRRAGAGRWRRGRETNFDFLRNLVFCFCLSPDFNVPAPYIYIYRYLVYV